MSEFARDVGFSASSGLTDIARRRRARVLPLWLRFAVILAMTAALWAGIVIGLTALAG